MSELSREQKIQILENNGWHHYYSLTHYVHEDIKDFFEKEKRVYFGQDYTNYQMTVDEAYELCSKYQIK